MMITRQMTMTLSWRNSMELCQRTQTMMRRQRQLDSELVGLDGTLLEKIEDDNSDKARATRQSRTRDTERRPRSQPTLNSLLLD